MVRRDGASRLGAIQDSVISGNTVWRLCVPAGQLAWRQWDGELVVYNPVSGATHVLDIASSEVLRGLIEAPAGRDGLAGRLAALLDVDLNAETLSATDKILEDLDRLGLAEPAAP